MCEGRQGGLALADKMVEERMRRIEMERSEFYSPFTLLAL